MTGPARRSAQVIVNRIDRHISRHNLHWYAPARDDSARCEAVDAVMARLIHNQAPGLSLTDFGAEDPDQFDRLHNLIDAAMAFHPIPAAGRHTHRSGRRRGRWHGGPNAA